MNVFEKLDEMAKHMALIKKQEEEKKENSPEAVEAKRLASESLELSRYRNERNLMLYPFCSTSKRKRLKTIEGTVAKKGISN